MTFQEVLGRKLLLMNSMAKDHRCFEWRCDWRQEIEVNDNNSMELVYRYDYVIH